MFLRFRHTEIRRRADRAAMLSLAPLLLLAVAHLPAAAAASASEGDANSPAEEASPPPPPRAAAVGGPRVRLSNGRTMPLVGVGVGNLGHELIPDVLGMAIHGLGHRLVDTAAASKNERLVAEAVAVGSGVGADFDHAPSKAIRGGGATDGEGDDGDGDDGDVDDDDGAVHVVTKVWYTHLGYERTKLSVSESLSNLGGGPGGNIKVHVLLHWPRCYDEVRWMDCEGEEERLPQNVKDAGPAPHLDRDGAWKGSWRALEDLYAPLDQDEGEAAGEPLSDGNARIESIGVSNFEAEDMEALLADCRVRPHVYQGNAWSLLHDPRLVRILRDHEIHLQAYNVMNGILRQGGRAPNALRLLGTMGRDLYTAAVRGPDGRLHEERPPFPPSAVVLGWLVQIGVSVVPRASSPGHRRANSPAAIGAVPPLSDGQRRDVELVASALMRGEDIEPPTKSDAVAVTFWNALSTPLKVFWVHAETGEEVPQHTEPVPPGKEIQLGTHPGHRFAVYGEDGKDGNRREFLVSRDYGEHQHFAVEEL